MQCMGSFKSINAKFITIMSDQFSKIDLCDKCPLHDNFSFSTLHCIESIPLIHPEFYL